MPCLSSHCVVAWREIQYALNARGAPNDGLLRRDVAYEAVPVAAVSGTTAPRGACSSGGRRCERGTRLLVRRPLLSCDFGGGAPRQALRIANRAQG